jgi:hypothetical protein
VRLNVFVGCVIARLGNCESLANNLGGARLLPFFREVRSLGNIRPGAKTVVVATQWSGSTVESTLISPSGVRASATSLPPNAIHVSGPTSEYLELSNPEAGEWFIELYGADVPAEGEDVSFFSALTPSEDFDTDGDGLFDDEENCPGFATLNLRDTDGDGVGDDCDTDADSDGIGNSDDNCWLQSNLDQADYDGDLAGDECDDDDDSDGCPDAAEQGASPLFGGARDPRNEWDFYDVTGDLDIDLSDALEILTKFGLSELDDGYQASYDRYSPDPAHPWRTARAVDGLGIDVTDALVNLASFGHTCLVS